MTQPTPTGGGLLRPRALLLDFGGVVVHTTPRSNWLPELAAEVHRLLAAAGCTELSASEIEVDIDAGRLADAAWKNAMSRPRYPAEMTHRRFWGDFVAADWTPQSRAVVLANATALCHLMGLLRSERAVRPGIDGILSAAADAGVPVAIVSNALCGAVHRDYLTDIDWANRFASQVYSDEVGVRKPNPEMIYIACRAVGVAPEQIWYVGDNFDRDVVCGRRAAAGGVVLMEDVSTYDVPFVVRDTPDVVVADPAALLNLLTAALAG